MSQELIKMLEWAAYKYNVHDYNEQANKIKKRLNLKPGPTHSSWMLGT